MFADGSAVRAWLRGAGGLAWQSARLAERVGADPRVTAVARRARSFDLFLGFTSQAGSDTYLPTVLRALDWPGGSRRLLVADLVPPGCLPAAFGGDASLVLALGPLDIETDGVDWWLTDCLNPDRIAELTEDWSLSSGALSLSTGGYCTVAQPLTAAAGSLAVWWKPAADETGSTRYLFDAGGLKLYFNSTGDCLTLTDGVHTITGAVAWTAGAELAICALWSSAGLALYLDGELLASGSSFTAPTLGSSLYLLSTSSGTYRNDGLLQVQAWSVRLSATQATELTKEEAWAWAPRWLSTVVEKVDVTSPDGIDIDGGFDVQLAVDGDRRWRCRSGDLALWEIDESGETLNVQNDGECDAFPVLGFVPAVASSTGLSYQRWVAVLWRSTAAAERYPVELTDGGWDTATLVTASKMQSDGDDLRVTVDGAETDRWLYDMNSANTQVWVNLDFGAGVSADLADDILSGDTITQIEATTDISAFPYSGVLMIGSEAFTYTSRDVTSMTFSGVTRAARGTAAAGHGGGDTMWWVQHEVWLTYGDSAAVAPSTDDTFKPAMELSSTNTSWIYATFGADNNQRAGQWQRLFLNGTPTFYGGNEGAAADPWAELGAYGGAECMARLYLYNPIGLSSANFTNGEKKNLAGTWASAVQSSANGTSWVTGYSIPAPSTTSWESWSVNLGSLTTGARYLSLHFNAYLATDTQYLEAADCTVGLNTAYRPLLVMGAEERYYNFNATVENTTTGESLLVSVPMSLGSVLIIDTDKRTVTVDGVNNLQALTLDEERADWLRLAPGANELVFTGAAVGELEGWVVFDRRYYR